MVPKKSNQEPDPIQLGSLIGFPPPLLPVPISPEKFARHTAILAQSGSGKSFFLGRLIEELLLKTSCNVLVLDPNSDFLLIDRVAVQAWKDPVLKALFLPEDTLESFDKRWRAIPKAIFTNRSLGSGSVPLLISWGSLTPEEAVELLQIDSNVEAGQYWFLLASLAIAHRKVPGGFSFFQLQTIAQKLARVERGAEKPDTEWEGMDPFAQSKALTSPADAGTVLARLNVLNDWGTWGERGEDAAVSFEGKDLRSQLEATLFSDSKKVRLVVIDLQSLDSAREQEMITSMVLDSAWGWARDTQGRRLEDPSGPWEEQRTPLFVVVDEAQNLAPPSTSFVSLVHEHLVRIATEGRKYDLFLIVVSQSPRTIDSRILSQCENACILRLTSENDIASLKDILGYPPVEIARSAVSFGKGDAILSGVLAQYPLLIHAFPRRTEQGGRGLSSSWVRGKRASDG